MSSAATRAGIGKTRDFTSRPNAEWKIPRSLGTGLAGGRHDSRYNTRTGDLSRALSEAPPHRIQRHFTLA